MERQRVDFNYHHNNYNQPPPPNYGNPPGPYHHHNNNFPQPPNFVDHHYNHHHQSYNHPPNYFHHQQNNFNQPPNYGDTYHHQNHYYNDYNQQPNYGPYSNGHGYFPDPNQHHQFNNHQNYDSGYFKSGEPNAPLAGGGGGGGGGVGGFHFNGRKRSHDRVVRGASPDPPNGATNAKLYIAPVPCIKTEEDLRSLFGEHGTVVEVIIPKDKWIDSQQGYCFVKYKMLEEADRAIKALNGYTFPGEAIPIKVRYADKERIAKVEREQGTFVDKLYVGALNKQTSKQEIEEIFCPYGYVEDVYIALDHLKQSRGYAFVKFSHRDMALAAIKALHGKFTMGGCDQPLIVRFAEPKKPRNGELRSAHNFGDSLGGSMAPIAFDPVKVNSVNAQASAVQHTNSEPAAPHLTEDSLHLVKQPPPNLSEVASQKAMSEIEKQKQNLEQQQDTQSSVVETEQNGKNSREASVPFTASDEPSSPNKQRLDPEECDWSEHTCPDGYKYYYNCETCESRWDKPEEFAAFQKRLTEQQTLQSSNQKPHAVSPDCDVDEIQLPKKESDHVHLLSATSQVVESTCA